MLVNWAIRVVWNLSELKLRRAAGLPPSTAPDCPPCESSPASRPPKSRTSVTNALWLLPTPLRLPW